MTEGCVEGTFSVSSSQPTPPRHPRPAAQTVSARHSDEAEPSKATEALQRRCEELERALAFSDKQKDEMLSMLAHELRNPLAPILTATEMIRRTTGEDPHVERYRCVIERQAKNLARLVDGLLDVSRVTRGKITLQKRTMDLGSIVMSAVTAARHLIDAERHSLEVRLPPARLHIACDPTRLEQVFVNLLDNASKYTPPGGKIEVEVEHDGHVATIRVRDNGIGMPTELLSRVFDLFVQGNRSLDRSQGGLGLGLPLVKSLVAMHDGTVEAKSGGAGLGSELIVRLPLEEVIPTATTVEPSPEVPRRALLALGHFDVSVMLAELLGIWGYEVCVAERGEQSLELARTFVPHVILLDTRLSGVDGLEIARRLRKLPDLAGRSLLVIGVSGSGDEVDLHEARDAGIDHHLLGPLDPKKIRDLLARSEPGVSPASQAG